MFVESHVPEDGQAVHTGLGGEGVGIGGVVGVGERELRGWVSLVVAVGRLSRG